MQKLAPYIGIALAVAVGVVLAPVVGWLIVAALACLLLFGAAIILRRNFLAFAFLGILFGGFALDDTLLSSRGPVAVLIGIWLVIAADFAFLLMARRLMRRRLTARTLTDVRS